MERNAIEEWAKWQVITSGAFLMNGGIYTLKYPYSLPHVPSFSVGPMRDFGPTNSTLFPFAANVSPTGPTLPIAGIIAMTIAPLLILLELDFFRLHNTIKMLLYLAIGMITITQLTLVQPATFLIVAAICKGYQ